MLTAPQKPANVVAFAFLLIAFLTGIASSFQIPTLSLFLEQEIHVKPIFVGLFYTINAVIGIGISQLVAFYSDRQPDRRKIMVLCCLVAVLGCLIFAFSRSYILLILFGTTMLGFGSSANPQSFALAREYNENNQRESVMFSTIMRTQISLAWIIGPPLSFLIALNYGFDFMYCIAGLAFLICAIISATLLPKTEKKPKITQNLTAVSNPRKSVKYLFLSICLMFICNSMYLINMPLYLIHQLYLNKNLAGNLMGVAAGLEIPVMLFAGYLTKFLSKKALLWIALVAGIGFYAGLLFAITSWQLFALQILNAIFIGILATIGMIYFQDLMPEQMGVATTLFSNSAKMSWVVGGAFAGIISEWGSYASVFPLSLLMLIASIFCLYKVKSV
ncbi:MAG: MFS transporter [Pasteurellaceae bacterium]|nr:MFS transporter [Pasteurellaceae bacterium]